MSILLQSVFSLFCRISLAQESEEDFLSQRIDLVYQNFLLDIPKLYDIAAIYGPLSPDQVKKLFLSVFESDNRYLSDFSASIDMMISLLKKGFAAALRVTEMINGDSIQKRS